MSSQSHSTDAGPRATEVSMVTTEHFVLQGARSATIAESTGRATVFLGAVSGGLVAFGLIATATKVGAAFTAFGLVLLPTLSFLGLVTFQRVLQSSIEDQFYARRIAQLRSYYFDHSPELSHYLFSVPPEGRLQIHGLPTRKWQHFLTVAGMVAVITAVLAGSAVALLAAAVSHGSLFYALVFGVPAGLALLAGMMRAQSRTWTRAKEEVMFAEEVPEGATRVRWHAHAGGGEPLVGTGEGYVNGRPGAVQKLREKHHG
jgi:hypothetical protein